MERKSIILQQSEWYIMEKLWEKHPRTIVQLYHALEKTTGWSKSTVTNHVTMSRGTRNMVMHRYK